MLKQTATAKLIATGGLVSSNPTDAGLRKKERESVLLNTDL